MPGSSTNQPECRSRYHPCLDAIKSCAAMGNLCGGEQIHSLLIKSGGDPYSIALHNHLLKLYMKCGHLSSALKLLDEMPRRNVISWNTVICGFVGCSFVGDRVPGDGLVSSHLHGRNLGFSFLGKMMLEMVRPDQITFAGVVRTCIEWNSIIRGQQAHCLLIKLGYSSDGFVGSAVIDLYAKFGSTDDARCVFDEISVRDLVLWNVMISCYALNGLGKEAFGIFQLMRLHGVAGDAYTFSSLLNSSCSLNSMELGQQIHCFLVKSTPCFDVVLGSAVVYMYGQCGDRKSARKAFDLMDARNVVSWNSIIVTYGKSGDGEESMKLLRQMFRKSMRPDELTLSSVLSSCAELAKANEVLQLHNYVMKSGLENFISIGNALIGAHAKCGHIYDAFVSFGLIPKPDVIAWTSMISACAFHGLGKEALDIFEKMLHSGVRPDDTVFLVLLSACSHSGLVDAGIKYFLSMVKEHGIKPTAEHYTCLVDLLGRAGFLDDAYKFLRSIPSQNTASNLGAFLGACKLHGNMKLAEGAADLLLSLQPNESVNYVLMSKIYAVVECWDGEERVRNMMRRINGERLQGCSWIEIPSK
ncbi:hypothetical protein Taro_052654 [Colocasia esculenta]|uniref:Pentatricopeptide repeat-containing protein n=1 Tax=Colocasia esculenta TaxID=4460 RepID=A0A843XJY8_COLES|nr:hypothetical protein [Colocasia esculenta]